MTTKRIQNSESKIQNKEDKKNVASSESPSKSPASTRLDQAERAREDIHRREAGPQTMEELLASTGYVIKGFKKGDILEGKITRVSPKEILIHIGGKTDGVVIDRELESYRETLQTLKPGDKVTAQVIVAENDRGQAVLSLRQSIFEKRWQELSGHQKSGESVDVVLNIESAFHYPDKTAFLKEIHRVLKPGGQFLIADLLSTCNERSRITKLWGKSMSQHFWNHDRYHEEFKKTELEITRSEDISAHIRKGWSLYRNWLPKIDRRSFFENIAFRIFYVLNVRFNVYFLKKQQYQVFTGYKHVA